MRQADLDDDRVRLALEKSFDRLPFPLVAVGVADDDHELASVEREIVRRMRFVPVQLGVGHDRAEPLAGELREAPRGHPELRDELDELRRTVDPPIAFDSERPPRGEATHVAVDLDVPGRHRECRNAAGRLDETILG
ncbi:MAG TPA: hypothetical protein VFT94_03205 [Gaiellaceae bacterium]|nr:hypothetical protein [Gaiellaceae bacterium]